MSLSAHRVKLGGQPQIEPGRKQDEPGERARREQRRDRQCQSAASRVTGQYHRFALLQHRLKDGGTVMDGGGKRLLRRQRVVGQYDPRAGACGKPFAKAGPSRNAAHAIAAAMEMDERHGGIHVPYGLATNAADRRQCRRRHSASLQRQGFVRRAAGAPWRKWSTQRHGGG